MTKSLNTGSICKRTERTIFIIGNFALAAHYLGAPTKNIKYE